MQTIRECALTLSYGLVHSGFEPGGQMTGLSSSPEHPNARTAATTDRRRADLVLATVAVATVSPELWSLPVSTRPCGTCDFAIL